MIRTLYIFIFLVSAWVTTNAQNNALIINGAYMVLNGGNFSSNIQLVINQGNENGIIRNSGHIITESQYNYIRWNTGATSGNYIFPTGYSTTDYLPIIINKTNTTTSDIKVSTWGTPTTNLPFADSSMVAACTNMNSIYGGTATGTVIDRWWDIVPSASLTADLSLSYRGLENTTTNPTGIINAQQWNGGQWLLPFGAATGVTTGIGGFTATGISNFSPIVLVNSGGILPIELISFTGKCEGNSIQLKWTTASELNNDYFTIEKSSDAINWESIGTKKGAGNSNQIMNYEFIDETNNRNTDVIYYRLKQTDYNGKSEYFNPISTTNCGIEIDVVVFPNPATDIIYIKIDNQNSLYNASLYSSDGKLLFTEKLNSTQINAINISDIASGLYTLSLFNEESGLKTTKKIVIY